MTVKVHEPKVTPPVAIAAEPNLDRTNVVEVVPDVRINVNDTGLVPIPILKTEPSGMVNCGGNDPSRATTLVLFRGTVALILRFSPVPEQANRTNELIIASTATI